MSHSIKIISRQASSCPLIFVLFLSLSSLLLFYLLQQCCEQLRKSTDSYLSVKSIHGRAEGWHRGGEIREKQNQHHCGRDAGPTRRFSSKPCGRGRIADRGINVRSRKRKAHEVDGDGKLNVPKDGAIHLRRIRMRPVDRLKQWNESVRCGESTGD
jgi:hypothetical protein